MRFQWYIINLDDGSVQGSNDVEEFDDLMDDDQFVILSGQHGVFYNGSRDQNDVEEFCADTDEVEDDEDDDGEDDPEAAASDAKLDLSEDGSPDGEQEGGDFDDL